MIRRLLKLLGGRKGGATRGGKGGSHVHKYGKRRSNKTIRTCSALEGEHSCNDPIANITTCDDPPFTCQKPWCTHCNNITLLGIDWATDYLITDEDPEEGDRS